MSTPVYSGAQNAIVKYGVEAGMLSLAVVDAAGLPTLNTISFYNAGLANVPSLTRPEGAAVVTAIGSAAGLDTLAGARDPVARFSLKIGNPNFLRFALRSCYPRARGGMAPYGFPQVDAPYRGMPVLVLGVGVASQLGGGGSALRDTGFTWVLRYAMINSMSIAFAEGQPVMATVELLGLLAQSEPDTLDYPLYYPMEYDVDGVGNHNHVLTWYNSTFAIAGGAYRDWLKSATVTVNNNCRIQGRRPDAGWDNPLSRIGVAVVPGPQTTTVQMELHANLDRAVLDGVSNAGNWGSVVLAADDSAVAAAHESRNMAVEIDGAMLSLNALREAEPGQPVEFTTQGVGRGVTISTTTN